MFPYLSAKCPVLSPFMSSAVPVHPRAFVTFRITKVEA